MIDWFEVANTKKKANTEIAQADVQYKSILNIYLDEHDTRAEGTMGLRQWLYRAYHHQELSYTQPESTSSCKAQTLP